MITATMMDPEVAAYLGAPVVQSSLLPYPSTPAEDARRMVRHGYAAAREETGMAAFFPDSLGDVGPEPGQPTRAIWAGGTIVVDAGMFEKLRDLGRRRFEQAQSHYRRQRQEQHDLQAIATALGVRRVTAHEEVEYGRTLYRAHTEPELATWTGGPQVRINHDELRRLPDTAAVIVLVATRLRQALVEHKLDEEQAARGGDR